MLAALAPLLVLHATQIAVKASDAVCPSTRQVSEAIAARLPGMLVPAERGGASDAVWLMLARDPATGAQELTLIDQDDRVRLRRALPAPATAAERECPALAETVALMVERYFQDLAYHGETIGPPARRRWDLFVAATWRPAGQDLAAFDARLGLARLLGRGRFSLGLLAGISGEERHDWPGATGQLRRYPAEARLLGRAGLGLTTVEAGPFAGIHLLVLDSRSGERTATDVHVSPVAGLVGGLRLSLGRFAFLRAVASLGASVLKYDFVTADRRQTVRFGTERLWGKMGIEAGFSFW
jgi:hypothetical protein